MEQLSLLTARLKSYTSPVCLAFSGGVDSALLLVLLAREKIPATAVTLKTALQPPCDIDAAREMAASWGVPHQVLEIDELGCAPLLANPTDRCYHCKKYLFSALARLAAEQGAVLMDGTNADDLTEYRPGLMAAKELGVQSPLAELSITKKEVREMAAALGLSVASRPSSPCLATRLPYGEPITRPLLAAIGQGEELLRQAGFPVVRLRTHPGPGGLLGRIEVPPADFERLLAARETLLPALRQLGYTHLTLDLAGFVSGSYDKRKPTTP